MIIRRLATLETFPSLHPSHLATARRQEQEQEEAPVSCRPVWGNRKGSEGADEVQRSIRCNPRDLFPATCLRCESLHCSKNSPCFHVLIIDQNFCTQYFPSSMTRRECRPWETRPRSLLPEKQLRSMKRHHAGILRVRI